ncbi:MAG: GtrA family protein [Clostridia bacterium]|nr:GtrA family protein [Clostridia bacterium]
MGKILNKIKAILHDRQKMRELTLYVVFGVLTTLVNWLVYFAVTRLLGMNRMEQESAQYKLIANIGNVTAWVLAVLFAFFTNKKYVFQSDRGAKTGAWKEFWLFISARLASLLIFDLALFNLLLWLGVNADWDKLLMNGLVILFNYFASSLVIFRKKEKE